MKIPRKKMTLSRLESTFWGVSSFISLDFDDANEFCETVVRVYKKDKINRNPDFHASSLHPPVEYVLVTASENNGKWGQVRLENKY
jgi:hypothetical protein